MVELTLVQKITAVALPLLLAITLHEAAHAWSAWKLGDDTAWRLGRVTLNPFRHIDLLGTIIIPIAIFILSKFSFTFGYAKPVPVNFTRLKHFRRDTALVAFAGPLANILMMFAWGVILISAFDPTHAQGGAFLFQVAQYGIVINTVLAVLNLIPILPLDGGRILNAFLPTDWSDKFQRIEPYGFFIILGLLVLDILNPLFEASLKLAWLFIGFMSQLI